MNLDQAWNEFIKDGYTPDNNPSKRECFCAGYMTALKELQSKEGKKTPYETINEWQDKFKEKHYEIVVNGKKFGVSKELHDEWVGVKK